MFHHFEEMQWATLNIQISPKSHGCHQDTQLYITHALIHPKHPLFTNLQPPSVPIMRKRKWKQQGLYATEKSQFLVVILSTNSCRLCSYFEVGTPLYQSLALVIWLTDLGLVGLFVAAHSTWWFTLALACVVPAQSQGRTDCFAQALRCQLLKFAGDRLQIENSPHHIHCSVCVYSHSHIDEWGEFPCGE